MKAFKLLFLSLLMMNSVSSQTINGITYSPSNPMAGDTITLYVDLTFTSGDCSLESSFVQQLDSAVEVNLNHCPGPLAYICSVVDTIPFVVDSAWDYQVTVNVYQGIAANPCEYAANPSMVDQISISVDISSNTLGVFNKFDHRFNMYPNPSNGSFTIESLTNSSVKTLKVYTSSGRLVYRSEFSKKHNVELPSGLYFVSLFDESRLIGVRRMMVVE